MYNLATRLTECPEMPETPDDLDYPDVDVPDDLDDNWFSQTDYHHRNEAFYESLFLSFESFLED